MDRLKKISAIFLIALVFFSTIVSILAIWEIIEIERIFQKTTGTLLLLFLSTVIILFVFSVIFKNDHDGLIHSENKSSETKSTDTVEP